MMKSLKHAGKWSVQNFGFQRAASNVTAIKTSDNVKEQVRPFNEVPRPGKIKFMRSFMPGGEFHDSSIIDIGIGMRKKYGNIFIMPGMFGKKDMVVTLSPSDIEMVFRNEGIFPHRESFDSVAYFREHKRPDVYGDNKGLIIGQNEEWGKLRSAANPIIMQPKSLKIYIEPLSNINKEFIERIKEIRDPNTLEVPSDFEEEMNRLIFESIALIAFDREMGIIRKHRDNPQALMLFKTSREIFRNIFKLDMQPSLWKIFPTPTYRHMMQSLEDSLNAAQHFVDQAQQELEQRKLSGQKSTNASIMERLMQIDKKTAVIVSLDLLFAGVDATTTVLSAVLLCLAKHPDAQQKVREEIMRVMPTKETVIDEERMKNLPYLRAVIKETLRCYPNGLGTIRQCSTDVTLSGYNIPAGTRIMAGNNGLVQDNEYFLRASEFLPERWLRDLETGKKAKVTPFTYLPFGFGPRMCIGKRIVDLELETTIATLLRNFHIEFNYDSSRPFKSLFVMEPAIPFRFKFTDINF